MCYFITLFIALILAGTSSAADVLANLRLGHPRLLFTDADLAKAVAATKTDPLRAQLHSRIIALAEAELDTEPIRRVLVGPRLLRQSRTCIARVLNCAMAFRLTGDHRFFTRAKKELFAAAAFEDWNPSHFLDVAEMSFAFAIGYDWLYAQFTPDERATLKTAMLKHGLSLAGPAYAKGGPTSKRTWFVTSNHNWNQVCNGGLLATALALADEEPALARLVIEGACKSLPLAMAAYAPDGAYPEGPNYWVYGTGYNVIAIAGLGSALSTDFGLSKASAFDRTMLYRLHVESPTGLSFNYADGHADIAAHACDTWLATRFNHAKAMTHCRMQLAEALAKNKSSIKKDRMFALHAVWFPVAQQSGIADLPLEAVFRGEAELAIFRSAWNDPRAIFAGFKAGSNDANHAHLDLGSFVLDADGVRWAQDLGSDSYNLPAYFGSKRWSYYRLNNHSHNTLTPGDVLQNPMADAPIVAFTSTPRRAHAVADLSSAYPGMAKKIHRGIALLDRARVLVQDDVNGLKPGTSLVWRMFTGAKIELSASTRMATIRQAGRTLRVEILSPPDATFSISSATPPTEAENQNDGVTALVARFTPDATDARLGILLTPVGDHWPAPLLPPVLVPLAEWD